MSEIHDEQEHFQTSRKKGRGRAKKSLDLIDAMCGIAEAAQPITGRGVGYKLFVAKLIASMSTRDMQSVYRLLKEAREEDIIPWNWIVDETRSMELPATWDNPEAFIRETRNSYRRDFWIHQPKRIQVWSEKGTVRGVLGPVLDNYGVGFMPVHGFSGATAVHDVAEDDDGRELIILYVGDWDPSGLCMSEVDLPKRLDKYGGDHVELRRIALVKNDLDGLPGFPAADKKKDPRYKWFVANYGNTCWELDAMDPNTLRARVEDAIKDEIEPMAWERCSLVQRAEQESLKEALNGFYGFG
jgi:hypothetical protein